ncbi:MAG: SpoIIE family protein phosphatase [Bacteroidia bacterium]|nr:SpoIIE family protein phosphatase [Bacteroidia bacterium]
MKYVIVTLLYFVISLQVLGNNNTSSSWKDVLANKKGSVNVYYFEVEPFSIKKEDGGLEGIEIELMNKFFGFVRSHYQVELKANFIEISAFLELYNTIRHGEKGMFGIASLSMTPQRFEEVQFSPPYILDIEVLICSKNIPIVSSLDEFKEVFKDLKALNVPNTTFEKNIEKVKKHLPDLIVENVQNSNEIRKRISENENLFSFCELPTYLLVLKKGLKIKRQNLFLEERLGYGFIYPKLSGWKEPVEAFFNDSEFRPFMLKNIQKYLGDDVKDLMWNIAAKDTLAVSKEIMLLNKEKEIQNLLLTKNELEIQRQKLFNGAIALGLALVLIITITVYYAYRQKRKMNKTLMEKNNQIEEKNAEIELAYEEISQKNKDITDSINYAKRIQEAIIIPKELIQKGLPDSFIYFKPKDIVSGDFYYYAKFENEVIITAVDCTGHGVPGAFMSMVGNEILSQIIKDKHILKPSDILTELHKGIRSALRQSEGEHETNDGMDIALCKLNVSTRELEYAGAFNPLYICRKVNGGNYEMEVIKADKMSIGGVVMGGERIFTNHKTQLNNGDTFYVFSDGYLDQFGGPRNKRFMSKKFRNTLVELQEFNMATQEEKLDSILKDWQGDARQIDDILVIGVRV